MVGERKDEEPGAITGFLLFCLLLGVVLLFSSVIDKISLSNRICESQGFENNAFLTQLTHLGGDKYSTYCEQKFCSKYGGCETITTKIKINESEIDKIAKWWDKKWL